MAERQRNCGPLQSGSRRQGSDQQGFGLISREAQSLLGHARPRTNAAIGFRRDAFGGASVNHAQEAASLARSLAGDYLDRIGGCAVDGALLRHKWRVTSTRPGNHEFTERYYNERRLPSAPGYCTPDEFREKNRQRRRGRVTLSDSHVLAEKTGEPSNRDAGERDSNHPGSGNHVRRCAVLQVVSGRKFRR